MKRRRASDTATATLVRTDDVVKAAERLLEQLREAVRQEGGNGVRRAR